MSSARAQVYISGTVQGVYFRASTQEQARKLGVTGWVKNLDDGRVTAVFEGEKSAVDELIEWCHDGSPRASVSAVDVTWEDPTCGYDDFSIRY
jgi:acylphosphatase